MLPREALRARRPAVLAARALILAGAAAAALLAAGCGDSDDSDGDSPGGPGGTELAITVDVDGPGGEEPLTETVSCDGGETSERVCAIVAELPSDPGAPVPPGTACTQIYGGPDEVTVQGTIVGQRIDVTLTRENGCEIDRFDRFLPLLRELFPSYEPGSAPAA